MRKGGRAVGGRSTTTITATMGVIAASSRSSLLLQLLPCYYLLLLLLLPQLTIESPISNLRNPGSRQFNLLHNEIGPPIHLIHFYLDIHYRDHLRAKEI